MQQSVNEAFFTAVAAVLTPVDQLQTVECTGFAQQECLLFGITWRGLLRRSLIRLGCNNCIGCVHCDCSSVGKIAVKSIHFHFLPLAWCHGVTSKVLQQLRFLLLIWE